ncbi:DUF3021 family protein [Murimonas intestini]|uniref:DUF3021 family protein n=1 Tax=Murimonas intestini TaxID=1337051 RepID=UPI0011DD64B0|nr:DUF3021 family protein [Murimonas intestini]
MKILTEKVIPMTTLLVTLTLIIISISNLIFGGGDLSVYIMFLQIAGCFFVLSCVEYFILEKIEFNSSVSYNAASFFTWYLMLGVCNFGFGWSGASWKNVVVYTLLFTAFFICIQKYSYYRLRRSAEEINRLLEKNKE